MLDVRSVADGAGEADDTSVTVSLCRMISIVSPGVNGSGAVGAGVSRASFAASSIVSRSCLRCARLRQKTEDLALVDRALDGVEIGVTREQDAHRARRERANLRQHLDAGHLRHAVIRDDHVDVLVADDVESLGAVRREEQIELAAEHDPHRVEHALLVVDEQESRSGAAACSCACMR